MGKRQRDRSDGQRKRERDKASERDTEQEMDNPRERKKRQKRARMQEREKASERETEQETDKARERDSKTEAGENGRERKKASERERGYFLVKQNPPLREGAHANKKAQQQLTAKKGCMCHRLESSKIVKLALTGQMIDTIGHLFPGEPALDTHSKSVCPACT